VASPALPSLETAAPPQFGGPGDVWSPETLLCASLADCFVLTFRAITRAARFRWLRLECRAEGLLERVGQVSQFTLRDADRARRDRRRQSPWTP
jgi:organic hydroperoxide reductase OsmC/OhrA